MSRTRDAIAEVERAELDWSVTCALDPSRTAPGTEVARLLKVARQAVDDSHWEDQLATLREEIEDVEAEKEELSADLREAESKIRHLKQTIAQLRWELAVAP